MALVRAAVIGIWATAAGDAQGDYRIAALQADGLDIGEDRRLDAAQLVGYVLQRAGGDLLPDDLTLVTDTEQHEATQASLTKKYLRPQCPPADRMIEIAGNLRTVP